MVKIKGYVANSTMMIKILIIFIVIFSYSIVWADTLKRIEDSKEINVGFRPTSIPLSFIDADGKPQGYAIDISLGVINSIKNKLKNSNIKVNWIQINPATRIPLIISEKIDFECSSTIKTSDRQKQVSFSPSYYVAELGYLNKKTIPIKTAHDLIGKRLAVIDGTLEEVYHTKLHLNIDIIHVKDNAEAMMLLEQDRVDVITQDDILLASLKAKSKKSQEYLLTSNPNEVYLTACMYQKNDNTFGQLIESTLRGFAKSGALEKSYHKWFRNPIPTLNNTNINFPMNQSTAKIIQQLKDN